MPSHKSNIPDAIVVPLYDTLNLDRPELCYHPSDQQIILDTKPEPGYNGTYIKYQCDVCSYVWESFF